MLRWPWVVLVLVAGVACIGLGIYYELAIRNATGTSGFGRWMAYTFYSKSIAANRWLSRCYVLVGSGLLFAGFLLRRRATPRPRRRC